MSLFSPSRSWTEFNPILFYWVLLSPSSLKLVFALGCKEKSVWGNTTCSAFSADKTEEEDRSFWSHEPPTLPLQHAEMGWQGSRVAGPHVSLRANRSVLICGSPGNVMAASFGQGKRKNTVHEKSAWLSSLKITG